MEEKILDIIVDCRLGEITLDEATKQVLNLFTESKRCLLKSILVDMDGKHSEYHREVVENYLDEDC